MAPKVWAVSPKREPQPSPNRRTRASVLECPRARSIADIRAPSCRWKNSVRRSPPAARPDIDRLNRDKRHWGTSLDDETANPEIDLVGCPDVGCYDLDAADG